ncbi:MAG: HIT family protein [Gammaproteobacteria bacterium]
MFKSNSDSDSDFVLDSRLEASGFFIKDLELSRLLLLNDARFAWVVLVPRLMGVSELFELDPSTQALLLKEISEISQKLKIISQADKINVASFGNQVPQLHIHIIARKIGDLAWPNSVFNFGEKQAYDAETLENFLNKMRNG